MMNAQATELFSFCVAIIKLWIEELVKALKQFSQAYIQILMMEKEKTLKSIFSLY